MMIRDHALSILHTKIKTMLETFVNDVSDGSCEDYADYRRITGSIRGIRLVERELLELAEKLEED